MLFFQASENSMNLQYEQIIEDLLKYAAPNGVPLDKLDYRLPEL